MKEKMIDLVLKTQQTILERLSETYEKTPHLQPWTKQNLGEGLTAHITSGKVFESGGVNTSIVSGPLFPNMLSMMEIPETPCDSFFATGISLILHPRSPLNPTVHMNFRYFELLLEHKTTFWFFGGGADLTPYYLSKQDCIHFHSTLKEASPDIYPSLKKACDDYFYLPHRKEHRGIGGIFSLRQYDRPAEDLFEWAKSSSAAFLPAYMPLLRHDPFTPAQREWQLQRRGRYVEFNLLYDLGTKFGLQTNANASSLLVSLPPTCTWGPEIEPGVGTEEAELLKVLRHPVDWVQ
jgi:coproporphyrinogen III oxidase